MFKDRLLLISALAVLITGCSGGSRTEVLPDNSDLDQVSETNVVNVSTIENSGWKLSSYRLPGQNEREAFDNGALSFFLQSEIGTASGFIECNAYGGNYNLDGDILSFSDLATDAAFCPDEGEHDREQEQLIFNALSQQLEVEIEGDRLSLDTSDGSTLYFLEDPDPFISPE